MRLSKARRNAKSNAGFPRQLASVGRDESGAVAVIFALAFAAILLASAVAIDFAFGTAEQVRDQYALDAAALAATDKLGSADQETAVPATAEAFLAANRHRGSNVELKSILLNPGEGTISGVSGGIIKNTFMKVFGNAETNIEARTKVTKGSSKVEVVLVLDNSGDMAGQPLADMKVAAKTIVGLLFQGASSSDEIRVGLVPYSGAVNVGPDYRGAAWLDNAGVAPTHNENFDKPVSRFSLFDQMNTAWGGCVEVRPAPYDVTDDAPTSDDPKSLFVPLFAPDEPDEINANGDTYTNNYIPDAGGTCTPQVAVCTSYSRKGTCMSWSTPPIPAPQAQTQTCKYSNASPATDATGPNRKGPNMLCHAKPLTRLTNRRAELISAIDAMTAAGSANIGEGVAWGWRLLSPKGPFADGADYNSPGVRKILVVLSRGANWAEGLRNINDSTYSAWGYGITDRLSPQSHTTTSYTNSMNEMTRATCRGASDQGVEVYTIGFGASDAQTRSMLQYCATNPHMAYDTKSINELMSVFEGISRMALKLRISG